MGVKFDGGYRRPYASLVYEYPGEDVYPPDSFRTEWGPIFHRGRLDGSARVLVIGQDPATHETICRRILVGEAGQRMQGLLAKLGITRSYVLINAFLYSVYGQGGGTRHIDDEGIIEYRNRWLDTLARHNELQAILTLGHLADRAYQAWKATPAGTACGAAYANVTHPTYPESASASGSITRAEAMQRLCDSWNAGLTLLQPVVTPDEDPPIGALRRDDHRRGSRPDPGGGPPGRAAGVDALARRLGVAYRRRHAN